MKGKKMVVTPTKWWWKKCNYYLLGMLSKPSFFPTTLSTKQENLNTNFHLWTLVNLWRRKVPDQRIKGSQHDRDYINFKKRLYFGLNLNLLTNNCCCICNWLLHLCTSSPKKCIWTWICIFYNCTSSKWIGICTQTFSRELGHGAKCHYNLIKCSCHSLWNTVMWVISSRTKLLYLFLCLFSCLYSTVCMHPLNQVVLPLANCWKFNRFEGFWDILLEATVWVVTMFPKVFLYSTPEEFNEIQDRKSVV